MSALQMHRPTFRCRCGKVYAMSEKDARGMRQFIAKKKGRDNPVRYYQCGFGGWHWTQMLEKNAPLPGKVFKECGADDCQNIFEANPISPDHTYCSSACKSRAARHRKAAQLERQRVCVEPDCGKKYDPVSDDQKYCGKACREEANKKVYAAKRRAAYEVELAARRSVY